MKPRVSLVVVGAAAFVVFGGPAFAQTEDLRPGWSVGPTEGQLGGVATIAVPDGYLFLDAPATRRFLEDSQNIPSGDELGTILYLRGEDEYWFAVFTYADVGHVDDGDRDTIDADAIMRDMLEGTRVDNDERRRRGWTEVHLDGWQVAPFYDQDTHNLTWSTRLAAEGVPTVNHSVRLLGRTGVMAVQLVTDAGAFLDTSLGEFDALLAGYSYRQGQRYAEFRAGDKLAGYGLAALIGAGAAGVAIKVGFLQKFWKLLVVGGIAVLGAMRRFFAGLVGRGGASNADERYEGQPQSWQ